MSQHTPGPWKVAGSCHVNESTDGLFYHVAHVCVADDHAPNPMVADISHRGRYCSKVGAHSPGPEQAANARLIAAAPELLKALEAMLTCNRELGAISRQVAEDARVAIAKAKGEWPVNAREQLGAFVVVLLESDKEWSADTTDAIAQKAIALGLADTDGDGMFRAKPAAEVKPSRVLITIEGGCLSGVQADGAVEVHLLDIDNVKAGESDRPGEESVDVVTRGEMDALLAGGGQ